MKSFERATGVTYLGFVYGSMSALKRMVPRGRGTVVQADSALAYRSIPLRAAYCGQFADLPIPRERNCRTRKGRVHSAMVQMLRLNTPQFDWRETRLPNHPQRVAPIFRPKWRRKRSFPGLLDRFLGKTGYRSQQTDEPVRANWPNNLFRPLPGDAGPHGRFETRAESVTLSFGSIRTAGRDVLIGTVIGAGGAAAVKLRR